MARATRLKPAAPGVTGDKYFKHFQRFGSDKTQLAGTKAPEVPSPPPPVRTYVFTREELYDLVWSVPIITLAAHFEVSGRGLAKICQRALIPVPKPGYWAKVQAGHPMARVPLPKAYAKLPPRVVIRSIPARRPLPPSETGDDNY
jgi:hypothetical protein